MEKRAISGEKGIEAKLEQYEGNGVAFGGRIWVMLGLVVEY